MNRLASQMRAAWDRGDICLHPTDSIPGLSFNPASTKGYHHFLQIKKRATTKGFVTLASSWERAISFWQPLPPVWNAILESIWPAPLSVVWEAREGISDLLFPKGERHLCIRVPVLPEWMELFLEDLPHPFPSTSVNDTGNPPIVDWYDAETWLKQRSSAFFCPEIPKPKVSGTGPSTVIQPTGKGLHFNILRQGIFDTKNIKSLKL